MAARILVFGETPEPAVRPDRPAGRSLLTAKALRATAVGEDWRAGKGGVAGVFLFKPAKGVATAPIVDGEGG